MCEVCERFVLSILPETLTRIFSKKKKTHFKTCCFPWQHVFMCSIHVHLCIRVHIYVSMFCYNDWTNVFFFRFFLLYEDTLRVFFSQKQWPTRPAVNVQLLLYGDDYENQLVVSQVFVLFAFYCAVYG